jgi:D-alanyl-D-alanine carboxypeptidase
MRMRALIGAAAAAAAQGLALAPAVAQTPIEDPRYAAILVDVDAAEVLYERRADLLRHPASITKVMTLYLAFDALEAGRLRLDDRVEMTPAAVRQPPSKIGLGLGQSLSVEQAIRLVAVKSANDIAVALAERIAGSHDQFVLQMNARAAELGMTRTSFANATGLPHPDNLTTARDIATLAQRVIVNHGPRYRYFSEQFVDWNGRPLANHNRLLGRVPGVDGIKTGFTTASGYTLVASARRDERRLVAVVLGSPTGAGRDANMAALIEAGFGVVGARARGQVWTVASLLGEAAEPAPSDQIGALIEQGSAEEGSRAD